MEWEELLHMQQKEPIFTLKTVITLGIVLVSCVSFTYTGFTSANDYTDKKIEKNTEAHERFSDLKFKAIADSIKEIKVNQVSFTKEQKKHGDVLVKITTILERKL